MWRRLPLAITFAAALIAGPVFGQMAVIAPTPPTAANNNQIATTAYVQNVLSGGLPLASGQIFVGSVGNVATPQALGAGILTWLATPNSANLRASISDETGNGLAYFQGGDIGTPSAGVATNLTGTAAGLTAGTFTAGSAANLTSGTLPAARTNGHMNGTATNDNGAAGEVGEFLSNSAGAVALTTATAANVGQISLTAGDWDVYCSGVFAGAGTTVTSDV